MDWQYYQKIARTQKVKESISSVENYLLLKINGHNVLMCFVRTFNWYWLFYTFIIRKELLAVLFVFDV